MDHAAAFRAGVDLPDDTLIADPQPGAARFASYVEWIHKCRPNARERVKGGSSRLTGFSYPAAWFIPPLHHTTRLPKPKQASQPSFRRENRRKRFTTLFGGGPRCDEYNVRAARRFGLHDVNQLLLGV
jgi:hypothetical protein